MQDLNKLWKIFNEKFTDTGLVKGAFSAPGRVNLIGEHTDYNEGFVLPMAIEKKIIMLGQLRNDRLVQVFDLSYKAEVKFAHLCRRAENNFVGVACGIMDQYVSCLGQKNYALFIDCRSNDYELIPFKNHNYQVVIYNSKIQRGLVNSEYNRRKEECKIAAEFFKYKLNREIRALRDITIDEYKKYQAQLPEVTARRARHVISENYRVQAGVKALRMGNYSAFGQLMIESHRSLKNDYQVSCAKLDLLVDLALKQEVVLGARMTGAGFGGCTVNLIEKSHIDAFKKNIKNEYKKITGIIPDIYVTPPADGAKVLELR